MIADIWIENQFFLETEKIIRDVYINNFFAYMFCLKLMHGWRVWTYKYWRILIINNFLHHIGESIKYFAKLFLELVSLLFSKSEPSIFKLRW